MNSLMTALQDPSLYSHPIDKFEIIETHLSWVLLTGPFAYKIKKPIDLGFADFSTLEKRQHFCQQELIRNRLLAPDLYLDVLPIMGSVENPSFTDHHQAIIEYTVKTKQFEQNQLLDHLQQQQKLHSALFISIGEQLGYFHLNTEKVPEGSAFGSPDNIKQPAIDNFTDCFKFSLSQQQQEQLQQVQNWTNEHYEQLITVFKKRKSDGFIRKCHGDIHLGNMVLINQKVVIFDCIEFNDNFSWIDISNDVAFLMMDLLAKKESLFAMEFLNHYLSISGDYNSLAVLNFYQIYRAMVRAKIALLTNNQQSSVLFQQYLDLASDLTVPKKPFLMITYGLSGSAKSTLANLLSTHLQAIHIRSDVERKRLAQTHKASNLYSDTMNTMTYEQLRNLANITLKANYPVIIDATFLTQKNRVTFQQLAEQLDIPFCILHCAAPEDILQQRIKIRLEKNNDPSDADLDVLQLQQDNIEKLTAEELTRTLTVNTKASIEEQKIIEQVATFLNQ